MSLKEQQIIINDLVSRLPYGVYCNVDGIGPLKLGMIDYEHKILRFYGHHHSLIDSPFADVKVYLRPLSDMTDEECQDLQKIGFPIEKWKIFKQDGFTFINKEDGCFKLSYKLMDKVITYLLKHHFDFRGLLKKNLALPPIDGLYKDIE